MKFLITGITGFAGPHLARLLLNKGHEVHGLIRATSGRETDLLDILDPKELSAIKFQYANLLNFANLMDIIKGNQYDGIFHLAAQSHPSISFKDPIITYADNVTGSINLITAIQRYSPDTVLNFVSTSEVYGDQCKDTGILYETDHLMPVNPYGASKAAVDLYMQERIKNGFIRGYITRAFSHTGPRRFKNFSISSDAYQLAVMKLNKGNAPKRNILQVGNLQTERVVIDVRDCVLAYYLLMKCFLNEMKPNNVIFNVCGTKIHRMQYFTDELIKISGLKNVEQVINPDFYRQIDIQVQIGDCTRLQSFTQWKPIIPIEVTLENLYYYWLNKIANGNT